MTAAEFNQWLADMKAAGRIRFEKEAYEALGTNRQTFSRWKSDGTSSATADYACAALLAGLKPYPAEH